MIFGVGRRPIKRGFTLIELMLVVAIIGLLAAIAVPRFADMITKAKEAAIKGKLGNFRGALRIYYADNEGTHPRNFNTPVALVPRYLDALPLIQIPTVPTHGVGAQVTAVGLNLILTTPVNINPWDAGNDRPPHQAWPWGYGSVNGTLVVNCTHTDSHGTVWTLQ